MMLEQAAEKAAWQQTTCLEESSELSMSVEMHSDDTDIRSQAEQSRTGRPGLRSFTCPADLIWRLRFACDCAGAPLDSAFDRRNLLHSIRLSSVIDLGGHYSIPRRRQTYRLYKIVNESRPRMV